MITCTLGDIVEFYKQYPSERGKINVSTRYGWKAIEEAALTASDSPVIQITVGDNRELSGSPGHLLWVNDRWCAIKDIQVGDSILTVDGTQTVTKIVKLQHHRDLYDLQVAEVHEFYANGIVSHNSMILNALTYALYGQTISPIKKDNLVNLINKKNMMVSIEFEKSGVNYRIERGRKPAFFRYFINDENVSEIGADEAQGENRETQKSIDDVLGISYNMFKNIVCLNTYTEPFLSQSASKQRETIEELLGITLLSQKADNLKELLKTTKNRIENEELRISTIGASNARITGTINDLQKKLTAWDLNREQQLTQLAEAISSLQHLNVEEEIRAHQSLSKRRELEITKNHLTKQLRSREQNLSQLQKHQNTMLSQYIQTQQHSCPTCGQEMHDEKQQQLLGQLETEIAQCDTQIVALTPEITELKENLELCTNTLAGIPVAETFYKSIEAAYEHRTSVQQLETEIQRIMVETNPFTDQLTSLNSTLQEIDYTQLNELSVTRDHQEFLLKLLTNKDSFIRKRIIDQNLNYVNHRLGHYLTTMGMQHQVKFLNDLSTEINYLGQDMDFPQLSRGESTRVVLSLSFAFRDIFENQNSNLNFLGVDELLDSGLDTQGIEKAMEILKHMGRDRDKNIMLISHREELVSRCDNTLLVTKEDGFSRIGNNPD
jgi:DNA repair exonuclease SbcCD ATPase subunit